MTDAPEPVHLGLFAEHVEGNILTFNPGMAQDHEPDGEDLVRAKVAQMRWLFDGLGPDKTWQLIACDDGCPELPSSCKTTGSGSEAAGDVD